MIIRHNLSAGNTERQMGIVKGTQAQSMQRLSSGYRINRAADDAAGLSISEKMRKQIRGLTRGIANTEDGISLCQVGDGALAEVHDMLQRMNELAVKAANGTNSVSDRGMIQQEAEALLTEIDRVGETTKFNDLYIFRDANRKMAGKQGTVTSAVIEGKPTATGRFFQLLGNNATHTGYMSDPLQDKDVAESTSPLDNTAIDPDSDPYVSAHVDFSILNGRLSDLIGTQFYVNCCTDDCPKTVKFTDEAGVSIQKTTRISQGQPHDFLSTISIGMKKADGSYYTDAVEFTKYIFDSIKNAFPYPNSDHVQFAYKGSTFYLYDIDNYQWDPDSREQAYFCDSDDFLKQTVQTPGADNYIEPEEKSIWIQSGADSGDGIMLHFGAVSTASLGISGVDMGTEDGAAKAIDQIASAIEKISAKRSRIGAQQNRLEHTVKNEQNIVENTTAAESQIRDTDMAQEMVRFSGLNILEQAVTSMLAQANQNNQGVLAMLSI